LNRIILYTFLVVIFSCSKKDHQQEPAAPTGLVLNLRQSALKIQNVDSADVVFRKAGTNETIKKKFVKHAGVLIASLKTLSPGTWNADVEVYTRAINLQSNQYKIIKPILVTGEKTEAQITGPGTTSGDGWLKRNVKASAGNEVVLILPDDVYDSFFEFRAKNSGKYVFGIQREAINTNFVVAQETWACTDVCLDGQRQITDIDHFVPFTQTILSSSWTKNAISIGVMNEQMAMILEYDRTWLP
jgi:hypothetical protein